MRKNKLLLLLALLMTAATGAWADGVTMKEITSSDIQSSWNGNTDPVKATDLPGFKAMTHDEAIALGAPSNDEKVYLIYAINASNKFAALIYESGTKSSNETEFNLKELQSAVQNYWVYYTYSAAPAGYTVSLEEGTKDAENWTGKVGEGNYGSLPLENVAEGAAVKLKYNGLRKVKSVTATTEASTGPVLVQSIELNYTGKMTIVGSNWLQIKTFRVLPTNATDKSVTWSVDGTHINISKYFDDGSVRIDGKTPGTGWVKATANDGSGVSVTLEVEFKLY